jgi:hypothetical protein
VGERGGQGAGGSDPVARRRASPDDRDRRRGRERLRLTCDPEHRGRIGQVEQELRIALVAEQVEREPGAVRPLEQAIGLSKQPIDRRRRRRAVERPARVAAGTSR